MDRYVDFVSRGLGKKLARQLGLPRPAKLRRWDPDAPLVPGPVLVVNPPSCEDDADLLAMTLLDWGLDVRRDQRDGERWGAVIPVLTGVTHLSELSAPALATGAALRTLVPGGRVVTLSRRPDDAAASAPTAAGSLEPTAAQAAVDGFLRSLAKELRAGATGNGLVLAQELAVDAPAVSGTLRFLLSGKSAYVDGQLLQLASAGAVNESWETPLAGRVAVVTGAARGIGAAIARTLARDGAGVVVVDVPAAGQALAQVANEVRGTALQLDVTAPDAAERIYRHATRRHGRLDVVVHNAGILRDKLLVNMTPERWDDLIAVNIAAPVAMNRVFAQLAADGSLGDAPRVISLASTSGIAGNRGQTNYAAAKAGIIGMTRTLAPALAAAGGTANAVAPGFIETDMTAHMPAVARELARRVSSLQQGGQPVDVAEAIAFLASPAGGGVNGQVLRVCGQNVVGQ